MDPGIPDCSDHRYMVLHNLCKTPAQTAWLIITVAVINLFIATQLVVSALPLARLADHKNTQINISA